MVIIMKKLLWLLLIMIIPVVVSADHIGEFKKSFNISVNCDQCKSLEGKEAVFQLYVNGEAVEGSKLVLNQDNDFKGSFEDLDVFEDDGITEINYEVRFLDDGEYRPLTEEEISYKTTKVSKWVSVLPEDIQAGHDYVFFTENWNSEINGYSHYVILTGTVRLEASEAVPDYKLINGKRSYYSLVVEPSEEAIWHVENVPEDDPNYELFGDFKMLVNNIDGKKLTLAGYNKGNWVDYIFKYSGKDGYIESEDAMYNNKVNIIPVEGKRGRFFITSYVVWPDRVSKVRYLGVDHFNNVVKQTEPENSAQILAFEYVEDQEVSQLIDIQVGTVLCATKVNPNTGNKKIALGIIIAIISIGAYLLLKVKKVKRYN